MFGGTPAKKAKHFWPSAKRLFSLLAPVRTAIVVVLAMVASVEAIFLSTFVLITQNRMAAAAEKRAELDLQVSLLTEHEITRLIQLVSAIGDRLGLEEVRDPELNELKDEMHPERVLDKIDRASAN